MDLMEKQKLRTESLKKIMGNESAEDPTHLAEYEKLLENVVKTTQKHASAAKDLQQRFPLWDKASYYNEIKLFLASYEKGFTYAKNLIGYKEAFMEHKPQLPPVETLGQSFHFPAMLKALPHGGFQYILPAMQNKRTTETSKGDGSLLFYTMQSLRKSHEKIHGFPSRVKNPVVIFVHHIEGDLHNIFVPDFDNLDIKVAIDGLQNFLIANDTIRDISLMQFGENDVQSYTDLFVLPKERLIPWLTEHSDLLQKETENPGEEK